MRKEKKEVKKEETKILNLKIIRAIKLMMIMELSKFIILNTFPSNFSSSSPRLLLPNRGGILAKEQKSSSCCMLWGGMKNMREMKLKPKTRKERKKGLIFQHTTAVTASAPSRVNEKGKQITVSCWWCCYSRPLCGSVKKGFDAVPESSSHYDDRANFFLWKLS